MCSATGFILYIVQQEMISIKKLHDIGIVYIQDLFDETGKRLTLNELNMQYNMNVNFLEYYSVMSAIPRQWIDKMVCKNTNVSYNLVSDVQEKINEKIMKLSSRQLYWAEIELISKQPTAIQHWIDEFPFLHDNDFAEYFMLANRVGNIKIQSFQFKILHRIFPCNQLLKRWKIKDNDKCTCGAVDTLEHYFYYCTHTHRIWNELTEWFASISEANIPLYVTDVILGMPYRKSQDDLMTLMNLIVVYTKWFIYQCKKNDNTFISFKRLLSYVRQELLIEIELLVRKNKKPSMLWYNIIEPKH